MTRALEGITKLPTHEAEKLEPKIEYKEVHMALKQSPNNKAPGLNGIPTELYKKLNNRWITSKNNDEGIDIMRILTTVLNDIKTRGVTAPQLLEG